MSQADIQLPQRPPLASLGETSRTDRWFIAPLSVLVGLSAFIIYSTWAALQNEHYFFIGAGGAHYLSPFYSPVLWDAQGQTSGHALFGAKPDWWPAMIPLLPAFLILWAPGGFRVTCYYYRGAYYKSFWGAPPACGVAGPHKRRYSGERRFPLLLQNMHRYFLYLALVFIVLLANDAWKGYWFAGDDGASHFGVHVGSLVLTLNVILLGGYTCGCHALRHMVGGGLDRLTGRPVRSKTYDCVSCLNRGHMAWAWASLFWVGFTDFYIRMCSMGVFPDMVIIG